MRTNVNYIVVAQFIIQSESIQHIHEVLNVLADWNPQWNPSYFMCDCSEAEIGAIELTFPSTEIHICDFHREQAWTRWVQDRKHGLQKEELLRLLLDCAWAAPGSQDEGRDYTTI